MNIFWIEPTTSEMAKALCDQHRSRMIYETCVLLCNAYYSTKEEGTLPNIYRQHYYNHPQCKWTREGRLQFSLIRRYLDLLIQNYREQGGTKWNREFQLLEHFKSDPPKLPLTKVPSPYLTFGNISNPTLNAKYKALQAQYGTWNESLGVWATDSWETAVEAYRAYYKMKIFKGGVLPTWKHNDKPDWYVHTDLCIL